ATLAEKPGDPEANLAVGRYRCFRQGNWERGLPLLVQGSDSKLKAAAQADLATPAFGNDQAKLADDWRELAKDKSVGTAGLKRAYHWYQYSQPGLVPVKQRQVERKLLDLDKVLGVQPLAVLYSGIGADEKWVDVTATLQKVAKGTRFSLRS